MGMDEIKITSKSTKGLISKIVRIFLRKKTGYDVDVQFGDIFITKDDDKAHVNLSVSADLSMDELAKILQAVGLE